MFKGALNLFRRSPHTGGRKANVAETTTTATPPANSGGIDQAALAKAIADGIAEQLKPITEQLGKLTAPAAPATQAAPAAAATTADKPLTLADFQKLLDDRDKQNQSRQQLESSKGKFVADKLKDLPPVYQGLLGNDPSKWAAEEQDIRTRFKADFKAAGGTVEQVGADGSAGAAPGGAIDLSKMTALEKMALGLKQSSPARK
jgi:hypothetical protein